MNFTLLFTAVENLSFVIDFKLSLDQKQDFLFFEGVNDSAPLSTEQYDTFKCE